MKNILITGGHGFIGKNLVKSLSNEYNIYSPNSQELDLLDSKAVRTYISSNSINIVIHAANRNNTRKVITPYDSLDGNLRMFFNIENCKDLYEKMIYFGSGAEYDREHYIPLMQENYLGAYIPADPYGFSKYIMAKTCETAGNIYELCLFGVYGKHEEWERRFISNAICKTLLDMDITMEKHVKFDYLWVDDLGRIVKWFIENAPKHKRYNVCRGEGVDLYCIAEKICNTLNINRNIVVKSEGFKPEYSGDNSRLMQEIGEFSFTSLEEGIRALGDFYSYNLTMINKMKLI